MDSFIFSVNAVLPLVTLVVLGYILRRIGLISPAWAAAANKLCFRTFLPVLLFINVYSTDSLADVYWGLSIFAMGGILFGFALGYLAQALFVTDRRQKGVVWQGVFRTNFAILGIPLAISLFGEDGGRSTAVLSLFAIPMFNIFSVVSLRGCKDDAKLAGAKGLLLSIAKNPLIIGVFLGFVALFIRWLNPEALSLSNIPFLFSAVSTMSQAATPLMLISLGAQFSFKSARGLMKPLVITVFLRIILIPTIILTTAFIFFPQFRGPDFASLISIFATPVAIAATVMAVEMGGDEELAGQIMFWTTVISAVTIFLYVLVFRELGALT